MSKSLTEVLKDIQHAVKTLTIKDLEDLDNAELAQIIDICTVKTLPAPVKLEDEAA